MLFEKKSAEPETNYNELRQELEHKSKFGFLEVSKASKISVIYFYDCAMHRVKKIWWNSMAMGTQSVQ